VSYTLEQPPEAYWVGDVPADPYESEILDGDGNPVDLEGAAVWISLRDPEGTEVAAYFAAIAGDVISVPLGTDLPFTMAGIYTMAPRLDRGASKDTIDPVRIAVQADNGWVTLSWARSEWRDAPSEDDQLFELLELARTQCETFAPKLAEGALVPVGYRRGQMMQARNIWNAARVDPSNGSFGSDSFVIRPFPLDWMVKQQLRPAQGVPRVG
jgi:hypothetical protein